MDTEQMWRLGHRPALDGLRGVAVLLVVFCHVVDRNRFLGLGSAGVTLFFVLSGFLITALLLQEHDQTGGVLLRAFYKRRALRLLPALFSVVAVVVAFRTMLGAGRDALRDAAAIVFYYANWASIEDRLVPLQHTWSLAIEEQFYVVWPAVLLCVLRLGGRKLLMRVALLGAVMSVVLRVSLAVTGSDAARVYLGTDTRADALLIGAALAVLVTGKESHPASPRVAAITLGLAACFGLATDPALLYLALPTLVALASAVAIVSVLDVRGRSWLTSPLLVLIGQRSYGIYLWNGPAFYALAAMQPPGWAFPVLVCALNWILAVVSWRYLESRFLVKKGARRLAPSRTVSRQH